MRRNLAIAGMILGWVMVVCGTLFAGQHLAPLYLLLTGELKPGQSSFMGDPAPTIADALIVFAVGLVAIALGFAVKAFAQRWRQLESVREAP